MIKKSFILLLPLLLLNCSTSPRAQETTRFTTFRPHQISYYHTNDTKTMMQAIEKTLMEDGFTIKAIHYDLGFVSASKGIDKELATQLVSEEYKGALPDTLEVTANLIQSQGDMRVKIHFVSKSFDRSGIVRSLEMVGNQEMYHHFFEKISTYIQLKKDA